MKDYLNIANSGFIFILCALVIVFVMLQCVIFLVKAWKEGLRIGLTRKQMIDAVKSSATFSVVPSIPILISLVAMVPILGAAFPWLRLSVVGSAPYELMSAEIGAQSMGILGLGGEGYTAQVFANSMWVMSVGIIWGLAFVILLLKKVQGKLTNMKKKDSKWMDILVSALFFGMLSAFAGQPVIQGGIPLATLLSGAAIMTVLAVIITRFKIKWLSNFALSISMIGAMLLAILYTRM